jgi:predicted DNA-binding WGR domain protein
MENLMTVTLEAHNPERNHHRLYQLMVGRDLLGYWTLTVRHGRVGKHGTVTRYSAIERDYIRSVIDSKLKRRAQAPRRLGCPYKISHLEHASNLLPNDWLNLKAFERSSCE